MTINKMRLSVVMIKKPAYFYASFYYYLVYIEITQKRKSLCGWCCSQVTQNMYS